MVANVPVNQGWPRNQITVSAASAASWTMGTKVPPDPKVPRTLWKSTW